MGMREKVLLMQMVFTCPERFAGLPKEYERYLSGDYFVGLLHSLTIVPSASV